jgi:hypothetical protein
VKPPPYKPHPSILFILPFEPNTINKSSSCLSTIPSRPHHSSKAQITRDVHVVFADPTLAKPSSATPHLPEAHSKPPFIQAITPSHEANQVTLSFEWKFNTSIPNTIDLKSGWYIINCGQSCEKSSQSAETNLETIVPQFTLKVLLPYVSEFRSNLQGATVIAPVDKICVWLTDLSADGILINGVKIKGRISQRLYPEDKVTPRIGASNPAAAFYMFVTLCDAKPAPSSRISTELPSKHVSQTHPTSFLGGSKCPVVYSV